MPHALLTMHSITSASGQNSEFKYLENFILLKQCNEVCFTSHIIKVKTLDTIAQIGAFTKSMICI